MQFKSGQIVCLESTTGFLYGEVIQVVTERQLCWVRPLIIALNLDDNGDNFELNQEMIDLRSASDLLLPLSLFRFSYETEVIPLLTAIAEKKQDLTTKQISVYLHSFVQQVWQNNQDKFKF